MFIRNETFSSFIRNYPTVTTIVIIHLVLFLWYNATLFTHGLIPFGDLIFLFGVGQTGHIIAGEYWRLLTPIFLHISTWHVIFNSFSLVLFGPALERMLGKGKFIFSYVTIGVLANVVTTILTGPHYTHLGASGAIFGLFGIYLFMVWKRKDLIDAASAQIVVVILILGVVMTFIRPNINITAHIFGLLFGFLLAFPLLKNARPFYVIPTDIHHNDREIQFRPRRLKRTRLFSIEKLARFIGWLFIIFVVIGILSRIL